MAYVNIQQYSSEESIYYHSYPLNNFKIRIKTLLKYSSPSSIYYLDGKCCFWIYY
jgi:hypothetical protein